MTLDEAIEHCEEVAEELEKKAQEWHENQVRKCELISFAEMDYTHENECKECASEHKQLAEWLKELKQLREQTRWIPISEKSPEEEDLYLVSVKNDHERRYSKTCWFHGNGNWFARQNVEAWKPLPEPYRAENEDI